MIFASIGDKDWKVWVLVEDLFNTAVIPSLLTGDTPTSRAPWVAVIIIVVTEVRRPRDELWRFIIIRGRGGGGGGGAVEICSLGTLLLLTRPWKPYALLCRADRARTRRRGAGVHTRRVVAIEGSVWVVVFVVPHNYCEDGVE